MNREQIEKAAGEYSGSVLVKDNPVVMAKHKAFTAGADWRINSAWHDARVEIPDRFKLILVEKDDEKFTLNIANGKMSSCPMFWVRWTYISDLLPERKEETE